MEQERAKILRDFEKHHEDRTLEMQLERKEKREQEFKLINKSKEQYAQVLDWIRREHERDLERLKKVNDQIGKLKIEGRKYRQEVTLERTQKGASDERTAALQVIRLDAKYIDEKIKRLERIIAMNNNELKCCIEVILMNLTSRYNSFLFDINNYKQYTNVPEEQCSQIHTTATEVLLRLGDLLLEIQISDENPQMNEDVQILWREVMERLESL